MSPLKENTIKLVRDFRIKSSNENGQNFLVDDSILAEEIRQAGLRESDVVLDIGAGFGSIESEARKKCKVIAIEKEIKCYSYLLDKYEIDQNVQLINADALDMIYPKFNKVVSNPPYSITDRILDKLLFYDFEIGIMIIPNTMAAQLLSEENSTRFSAVQKIFFGFSEIMKVGKEAFYPQPRITSRMVKIVRRPNDIRQQIFRRREMTLKNAVISGLNELHGATKKEGKKTFSDLPNKIKALGGKQVKRLSLDEIDSLARFGW